MGSDMTNEEAKIPYLLFFYQKHSVNSILNSLQCELFQCLAGKKKKGIRCFVIGQGFKNWCHNVT
jgi:hypothetical protein